MNTLTASRQRGNTLPPMSVRSGNETKQFDDEVSVMLELWGMQSTPSLRSLSGPLWPGVIAPDRVLSMGSIELNCNYAKLNCLKLTVVTFNCVSKLCTHAELHCLNFIIKGFPAGQIA